MGNHRFKLSDMMPNAWFYKLKDMNKPPKNRATAKSTSHNQHQSPAPKRSTTTTGGNKSFSASSPPQAPITPSRASYYFPSNSPLHPKAFDTHFPPADSPRKSLKKPRRKPISPRLLVSSSSNNCSSRNSTTSSDSVPDQFDIVFDAGELDLPPIITKKQQLLLKTEFNKPKGATTTTTTHHRRVRLSAKSPKVHFAHQRIMSTTAKQRKSISESFAVVKNSSDPKSDFRESMMEMIRVNELKTSKDLEDLLACFLSLNCNEYHDVIVKVFQEIWLTAQF